MLFVNVLLESNMSVNVLGCVKLSKEVSAIL